MIEIFYCVDYSFFLRLQTTVLFRFLANHADLVGPPMADILKYRILDDEFFFVIFFVKIFANRT
jgi:hypothetical protein